MADPNMAEFRFAARGLVSATAPDLLQDGQYRNVTNCRARQDGSLSSRTGAMFLGQTFSPYTGSYHAAKLMLVAGENPQAPSTNLRYIGAKNGLHHEILRTSNYQSFVSVLNPVADSIWTPWEMAPYSAGGSGSPWAYFATPSGNVRDNGAAPYGTLAPWGVLPAFGVSTAVLVTQSVNVTAANPTLDVPTPVQVLTLALPAGISTNDKVSFTGIGIVTNGHVYAAKVYDSTHIGLFYDEDTDPGLAGTPVVPIGSFSAGSMTGWAPQGFSGALFAGPPKAGGLDGGANSSPNGTTAYDWVACYIDGDTRNIGNPSQTMLAAGQGVTAVTGGAPLSVHGGQATITIWGTDNPKVSQIALFRRGGILFDTWRQVATVTNPGWNFGTNFPNSTTYVDSVADADLQFQTLIETDNNPPVTSTPLSPLITSISNSLIGPGQVTVNLTAGATFTSKLTRGTLVHIAGVNGESPEDCTIEWINSGSVNIYLQFQHSAGDVFEVDALTAQPCHLAMTFSPGDCVIVAGDPNNPHTAYKSKSGNPEAFPVGTDAAGAVTQVNAGTPSNPIMNFCEYRGAVLFMNLSSLYESVVLQGSLTTPLQVTNKGLLSQSAWCKTASQVWFLSTDGIYSWDGGTLRKRSQAIDPIFHGESVNNIPPVAMTGTGIFGSLTSSLQMAYRRGRVYLMYTTNQIGGGTAGRIIECEPSEQEDQWRLYSISSTNETLSLIFSESDTDSLILGFTGTLGAGGLFGLDDQVILQPVGFPDLTSDLWTSGSPSTTGGPVPYDIWLPWFNMGSSLVTKLFEEAFLECDPQISSAFPGAALSVDILLNFSDTPVETIQVVGNSIQGRQNISLLPQTISQGGILQSFGREATAISWHIYGQAYPVQATFYRLLMKYQETGMITAGASSDWDTLGHPWSKRLYRMTIVFDTKGINETLLVDTITGPGVGVYNQAGPSMTFTLNNPTIIGNGRAMQTFPLPDATIVKMLRVRQAFEGGVGTAAIAPFFRIHSVLFPGQENYPEDVTTNTPWDNGGYEYLKYCNQVALEVNTNGSTISVQLQSDGGINMGPPFTVTSTDSDRQRNITFPTGLTGYRWRLFVDPTQSAIAFGNGMFQVFHCSFKFQQADRGEVGHTFDWDDLGHPYDKLLLNVTFEYDTTAGGSLTLQLDTISGISGTTFTSNVKQFVLGTGRGKTAFPLPPDTVAKMVRIYPIGTMPTGYKQWKYLIDKVPYPADFVRVTAWKDASAPVDKEPSWLWIDADTNGVAATVNLQNENGTVITVQHTGTSSSRKKNYAIPADTHAKMWRLTAQEGVGGRLQLFDWGFQRWETFNQSAPIDPPEILLATPWNDFGYPFGKLARDLILTINTGGVACSVALQTNEAGTVATFPAVNTTYTTRRVVLSCPANLQGTQWRLQFTPGTNGLSQLWGWALDAVKMPPALTTWSSYGQGFGYKGWKFLFQFWFDYTCAGGVNVTFTSDTGSLVIALPAHPTRAVERDLFGDVWGAGFNKSKLYGVSFVAADPTKPFQIFADVSGVEWMPIGGDRHAAFKQAALSSFMQIQI
jgi:hypothetical protein